MLPGVVPFPPEFAQRYRDKGYWLDKPLREEFAPIFAKYAEREGDFQFGPMIRRVQAANSCLKLRIVLGKPGEGEISLTDLIEKPAPLPRSALDAVTIDPADPCIFQLSGGTTGIPKLIPRSHNDYAYNSKTAAPVCGVTRDSVLLLALPIAHNLPLACPGIQGYFLNGGEVVLSPTTKP